MHPIAGSIDVFLQPGEYFVGDGNHVMRTILGSCVSITLWHPASRIGAMSHFLLPYRAGQLSGTPDGRYGAEALSLMLHELRQMGIDARQCESKIFGGGNMFPAREMAAGMQIGQRNGEIARELLQTHGIPIVSEDLYGIGHRQIIFHVATGDVWVRHVPLSELIPAGVP